jgi:hypothetical protein
VSYESRRSRRRRKLGVAAARREHGEVMRGRYYLTRVRRACRCAGCGGRLVVGGEMVFRKDGPVTLCVRCADRDPLVEYRTSVRWEQVRRKEASR